MTSFDGALPFAMETYAQHATGPRWPALPPRLMARELICAIGIRNRAATPPEEVDVYRELVMRQDKGRAYLQIMRNIERARHEKRSYEAVVDTRTAPYPVQIIWGVHDPVLSLKTFGHKAREAAGLDAIIELPGKHFLQEDLALEIAAAILQFCFLTGDN